MDEEVEKVLISMSTPGGQVSGISDLSDAWGKLNSIKPITVHTNGMLASAGYWLAVHSDKIYASQVAEIGSIGVMITHVSHEEALKKEGIKVTEIKSAPKKAIGTPAKNLTEEEKQYLQTKVEELSKLFEIEVYKNRASVSSEVFSGETFLAAKAKSLGLIDDVKTYSDVFTEMVSGVNNQTVGGDPMKKKVTAEMYESAVAAGADPNTLEIVSQEEFDALAETDGQITEASDQTVEAEAQEPEESAEAQEPEEVAEEPEAVAQAQARISELEAEIASMAQANEQLTAELNTLKENEQFVGKMKDFLTARMGEMRTALGLSKIDMSEFTVATVVTEYEAIDKTFKKSFKVGGVVPSSAKSTEESGKTKKADITYIDRARLKAVGV